MDAYLHIILPLAMGCVAAYFASKRNRNPVVWFFIGVLLGLIGVVLLFILPPVKIEKEGSGPKNPSIRHVEYTSPLSHEETVTLEVQPIAPEEMWYYLNEKHEQFGPVAFTKLRELYQGGTLSNFRYVWKEGMSDWKMIEELLDLQERLR